jgi:transcriptional regulator with XRE-family HTH domain
MTKITVARMTWRHEVGHRIRMARKNANLTLEEVGEKLGFGKQNVAGWESAASEMKIWDLMRAAKLYNVSTDELLTGKHFKATTGIGSTRTVPKLEKSSLDTVAEAVGEGLAPLAPLLASARGRILVSRGDLSSSAFAFDVFDSTLDPEIKYNDTVIVDRANLPKSGEVCLFYLGATRQILLRWYQGPGGSKKLPPSFALEAQNDNLIPPLWITADHRPTYLGAFRQLIAQDRSRIRSVLTS